MPQKHSSKKNISVALAGNPNSGKTTIFNRLTGTRQHVGNYPGVTVEKKEGTYRHDGASFDIVDLPGTYSLTAYTVEERVARNYVMLDKPDVVVDVVDASNLERNLFLAIQIMELGVPMVLAFNMSDVAKARGFQINTTLLSELLGVTIVETVGSKGQGMDALKDAIVAVAADPEAHRPSQVTYGGEVERELERITHLVEQAKVSQNERSARWTALKLLEQDDEIHGKVTNSSGDVSELLAAIDDATHHLKRDYGDEPEILIADRRYGYISGACQEAVQNTVESRHILSDDIDRVLTHPVLGIGIFFGLMYVVFYLTFTIGGFLMTGMEGGQKWLAALVAGWFPAESALKSLAVDGIIGGVGGVIVFLPPILILFLAIAILEDSGYMARAAFIMDRWMHKIGLHGKSFIPLLIGFGCTVPAIMATRTLESRRDRMVTMLIAPFMSCGARIPIYVLFVPAFFSDPWQAPVMFIIYMVGILFAIASAKLLRMTLFKGKQMPFVMELPPYRMPTVQGAFIHMWERGWMFLKKAGTIILLITVLLWAASSYPKPPESELANLSGEAAAKYEMDYSVAGRIGKVLHHPMQFAGFDERASTATIGALAAKEAFVSQLGTMFSMGDVDVEDPQALREILPNHYSPLQAFSIMIFCLLSAPCVATLAATWRESGHWKWAAFQFFGLAFLAYGAAVAIYQIGILFSIGAQVPGVIS
jgi:ferrous iron transport protein B